MAINGHRTIPEFTSDAISFKRKMCVTNVIVAGHLRKNDIVTAVSFFGGNDSTALVYAVTT